LADPPSEKKKILRFAQDDILGVAAILIGAQRSEESAFWLRSGSAV
jgi:hypothetical protein